MIKKVSIFILFIASFLLVSCDLINNSADKKQNIELSVKESEVSSAAGSQFISVICSGAWQLSLVSDEGEVSWARLSVTEGVDDKSNIVFSYDKNESERLRELRIVLTSGSKWTDCTFVQLASKEDVSTPPTPGTPTLNGMDLTKKAWLELPALDDPNLNYYTHSFSMSGKSYRNYSFGWSQKDRVALWVAYPLCDVYTNGSAGRTNAWALDPLLGNFSAAPFGGYGGSYARGHQLPSADRQCCYEANAQTFYGTNMTPQLNEHNEGIWAALEGRVRTWSDSADTLYVVTGVVVSPSSRIEKDSYGNNVTVPDAYFKAVLKYSKSSTLGTWNAAAFYLEHRAYSGGIQKSHSMSIDKLEEKTGIDFFANLPAKVGEATAANIEKQDPATSNVWW